MQEVHAFLAAHPWLYGVIAGVLIIFFQRILGIGSVKGPCTFTNKTVGFSLQIPTGWSGRHLKTEVVAKFENPSEKVRANIHTPRFSNLPPEHVSLNFRENAREYVDQIRRDIGNAPHYQNEREVKYVSELRCNDGSKIPAITLDYNFQGKPHRKIATFLRRGPNSGYEFLFTFDPSNKVSIYDALARSLIVDVWPTTSKT